MTRSRLVLTRAQILAFRRRVGALDERLARGRRSLRLAAWAGLQDSMPRAALLSIHARVAGAAPTSLDDPSLIQLWGPRHQLYVTSARDLAVFSLGLLPDEAGPRRRAIETAERLRAFLDGRKMTYGEAGDGLGVNANSLRYAAPTGTVLLRWEGARAPIVWTVPAPEVDPRDAGFELARRYLHVYGPSTTEGFTRWTGLSSRQGRTLFEALGGSLTPVRTPIGDRWILSSDEAAFRGPAGPAAPARLLPSGDPYFLLWEADREVLVTNAGHRQQLWTSRVWPGALLVDGEVVGTWRRADAKVSIQTWRRLPRAARDAVEAEASTLPLPGIERVGVRWER